MCAAAAERPGATGAGNLLSIVPLDDTSGGLRLIGEVDISNRRLLAEALEAYVHKTDDVHLELEELSFIDVGGVSMLVSLAERLSARRVVLRNPPRVLCRIVELAWPEPTPLSMVGA